MTNKMKVMIGFAVLLALLGLVLLLVRGCPHPTSGDFFTAEDVATNVARAEPIIKALEAYRKDNKGYPDKLELLVPKYLPEIPPPAIKNNPFWSYSTSLLDGTDPDFALTFVDATGYPSGTYSHSMQWSIRNDYRNPLAPPGATATK